MWSGGAERASRAGCVATNGGIEQHPEAPFGGFKRSGIGRDGGSFAFSAYSALQTLTWA